MLAGRRINGPPSGSRFDVSGSRPRAAHGRMGPALSGRVAASDERRTRSNAMRCVFFASPGSAPYRTRSAAADAPPSPAALRGRSPRRRPDRGATLARRSSPPGDAATPVLRHPGSPRRPMPPSRQRHARLRHVRRVGGRRRQARQTRFGVHPDMRLPEVPLVSLLVWCISGSRSPLRFFVDDGASMMLASTIVPVFNRCPRDARCTLISSNNPIPKPCVSSRWRKFRIVVSSGKALRRRPAPPRRADPPPGRSSCRTAVTELSISWRRRRGGEHGAALRGRTARSDRCCLAPPAPRVSRRVRRVLRIVLQRPQKSSGQLHGPLTAPRSFHTTKLPRRSETPLARSPARRRAGTSSPRGAARSGGPESESPRRCAGPRG